MATAAYMNGRKKYGRPQAMLWSENSGRIESGAYVPNGFEVGYDDAEIIDLTQLNQFIVLSDHGRKAIDFAFDRIEQRERMVNGRMRSYHIADKLKINVSWDMLPSRSFSLPTSFNEDGKQSSLITESDHDSNPLTPSKNIVSASGSPYYADQQYTADGGAGGVDLLDWYRAHPGPFWVYLAYDNYSEIRNASNQETDESSYQKLNKYNQIVEMYIADFSYSVVKRGTSTHDFWNISVSLEEV
jgi:hypothetical protein